MKKALGILAVSILSGNALCAQNFKLLFTDAQDATNQANLDIKTISYDLDHAQDSIWFKIETYNEAGSAYDDQLTIAIDGNLDPTDGTAWWKSNQSMKYDRILFVFKNTAGEYKSYYEEGANYLVNPATVIKANTTTYIIRMQLSAVDADGAFNFIVASGNYDTPQDKAIFDEAPNDVFLTIINFPAGIEQRGNALSPQLYPNPAGNTVTLRLVAPAIGTYLAITNLYGQIFHIQPVDRETTELNLANMKPGMYIVNIHSKTNTASIPLVIR